VSMSAAVTLALLFLSVGLKEVQGCSCSPGHPQEQFCMSEIGTKVPGQQDVVTNLSRPLHYYSVFKGFDGVNETQHVYTNEMPSVCGIRLARGQYLLSGRITPEGFFVSLCDYFEVWDKLSLLQKENLKYRYLTGCTCMISTCIEKPCQPSTKNECMQTDWSFTWQFKDGESVHESACIRHSDGSCGWYEGTGKPSENDIMSEV
uniref:TIMP metallopeptidase inhibitor 4 n=2 Tax=Cyprinus carpio TaxID=7962 RepID=A0A9J8DA30_CYPCA